MKKTMLTMLAMMTAGAVIGADYQLDASHTQVGFKVKHLGISTVSGQFKDFSADISYDGKPETLSMSAEIVVDSIDTGNEKRDAHLKNEDFFEASTYPTITFESTGVKSDGDDYMLTGNLTMKDVTKEVALELNINGPVDSPWGDGSQIIGLALSGTVNRQDFGVAHGGASDNLIGDEITLDINAEAKK